MTLFPEIRTDSDSESFLTEVVDQMVAWFPIDRESAIRRVNDAWRGRDLVDYTLFFTDPSGPRARRARMPIALYNDCPCFWAQVIWYGERDFWREHGLRECHSVEPDPEHWGELIAIARRLLADKGQINPNHQDVRFVTVGRYGVATYRDDIVIGFITPSEKADGPPFLDTRKVDGDGSLRRLTETEWKQVLATFRSADVKPIT